MTVYHFIALVLVGAALIAMRIRRTDLDRREQMWLVLMALAALFAFFSPVGAVTVLALAGCFLMFAICAAKLPLEMNRAFLEREADFKGYDRIDEVDDFIAKEGFSYLYSVSQPIAQNAIIISKTYSKDQTWFLNIQRQIFRSRSSYTIFLSTALSDGRHIMTTDSQSNFDQPYPERYPIFETKARNLSDLFAYHRQKVAAVAGEAQPVRLSPPEMLARGAEIRDAKIAHAVEKGVLRLCGDHYRYTAKGAFVAMGRFFDFSTMFKEERVT